MSALELYATKRFLKSYERGTVIQFLAEGALHDFVRRYESDPSSIARQYQRIAGGRGSLLEFEISGGCRMIGHWNAPRLTLLDVGGHELVPQFDAAHLEDALRDARPAPKVFFPGGGASFFLEDRVTAGGHFANETSADWIYFLDDEQDRLATFLCEAAESCLLEDSGSDFHFVLGGPGTGKTCILLNLFKRLHNREKFATGFSLPVSVKGYIESSIGLSLAPCWIPSDRLSTYEPDVPLDVMLIDDPRDLDSVRHVLSLAKRGRVRFIVAAFDPLQLNQSIADNEFFGFVQECGGTVHLIRQCYRQKENVGQLSRNAATVIADSTPFLEATKKREYLDSHVKLTTIANDLEFKNPLGYVRTWMDAGFEAFSFEIKRISQSPGLLWKHAPSLLVVLFNPSLDTLPADCQRALDRFPARYVVLGAGALSAAKGLEFQHVFIVTNEANYRALQSGFHGTGARVYEQRRLLRIPFSRSKDSLVVFVWKAHQPRRNTPATSRARP